MKWRIIVGVIALAAVVWIAAPEAVRGVFTWQGLEWDRYIRAANVYDKVGADTVVANQVRVEDVFFVPSVSTLPTCDSDIEAAILFDQSDNRFKGCSDQRTADTFQWERIGFLEVQTTYTVAASPGPTSTHNDAGTEPRLWASFSGNSSLQLRSRLIGAWKFCSHKSNENFGYPTSFSAISSSLSTWDWSSYGSATSFGQTTGITNHGYFGSISCTQVET